MLILENWQKIHSQVHCTWLVIIGSNILPHNVGKDASIVQVRKLNAALTLRAFAGNDAVICQGQSAAIGNSTGATGGVAPFTYSWSPTTGVANPTAALTTAAPTVATQYVLTVTDFAGNTVKDTVLVSVTSRVNLGPDTTVYHQCYGDSTNLLTLYNTTGLTALWNTANPGAVPPGNYRLIATNATGCPDTAFAKIVLEVATWTGNVSANWHTAGNWSTGKVPSAITHVIIAPTSANNCEVSAANGVAASLQVRNGGALVLLNGMTVIITGSCLVLPP
jgi:hypothetical protein